MKKLLFGAMVFGAALLCAPVMSSAAGAVKYIEISVKSVKVWPVKPSGKCWDPCFMKKFKLPARGNKDYSKYFGDQEFRKACTGSKAPDPFVEIKVGKYETFVTDKINNQCNPTFSNVKKVFRVPAGASFQVTVYDNDGAGGFRVKKDLMGTKAWATVPPSILEGKGDFTIKSFGQVEELVISAKVVQKPKIAETGCAGTYKVRIVEVDVHDRKANGKTWDRGFGSFKKPDIFITSKIGDTSFRTPAKGSIKNVLNHTFNGGGTKIAIKKGEKVRVTVWDGDGSVLNQKEKIGETALGDVCTVIKAGGQHTFTNFDRVKKLVIIFTKEK